MRPSRRVSRCASSSRLGSSPAADSLVQGNGVLLDDARSRSPKPQRSASRREQQRVSPAARSWLHWRLSRGSPSPVTSRWTPLAALAAQPAVMPGSWAALAVTGIVVGLVVQNRVLAAASLPTMRSLSITAVGILVGIVVARLGTWLFTEAGPSVRSERDGASRASSRAPSRRSPSRCPLRVSRSVASSTRLRPVSCSVWPSAGSAARAARVDRR